MYELTCNTSVQSSTGHTPYELLYGMKPRLPIDVALAAISPTLGLLHFDIHVTQPSEEFISKRKGSKTKKTGPKGVTRDIYRSFIIDVLAKLELVAPDRRFTLLYDCNSAPRSLYSALVFL